MHLALDRHPDYVLDRRTELAPLQLQARVWEPAAESLLAEVGVLPGGRAVDLGCGAMGVLRALSAAVGPTGVVIGIDNDQDLLTAARGWGEEQGLHNVWLMGDDAYGSALPRACFDLVHARFLLCPCGRGAELVREMIDLARPGATIALQEPDPASWHCFPRRAGWDALKPAIIRAFRSAGGDFDSGQRIHSLLRVAGLQDVRVRAHVLALEPGHPYRRLPVQFATSLRQRILDGALMTESQLDAAVADCEAAAADENTVWTTFTVMQAWGRKAA